MLIVKSGNDDYSATKYEGWLGFIRAETYSFGRQFGKIFMGQF